ncbi:hypothetical protein C8R47DRAFT_1192152 [Mycena vitilis]|nr:hypothetical protein C8R47DRAFT_1192152 [Mycena vitilis]
MIMIPIASFPSSHLTFVGAKTGAVAADVDPVIACCLFFGVADRQIAARRRGSVLKDDGWRMHEWPMKADCPPASSFRPSAALRRRRFPRALCCGCPPASTSTTSTNSTNPTTTSSAPTASTPATSTANANANPTSSTSPASPSTSPASPSALTTPGYSTHHSHHTPAHLSISLDTPPSASPFPSPSSSFLPPPIPGAHEFAMKDVPVGRKGGGKGEGASGGGGAGGNSAEGNTGTGGVNGVFAPAATSTPISSLTSNAAAPSVTIGTATATSPLTPSPATPTPANTASNATLPSTSATTTSALTPTATPTPSAPTTPSAKRVSFPPSATAALGLKSHSNSNSPASTPTSLVFSLDEEGGLPRTPTPSSSRPAPPSPALSRRTSLARSESRRQSGHSGSGGGSGGGPSAFSPGSSPENRRDSAHAHSPSRGSGSGSKRTSRVLAGARHRLSRSISAADVEGEGDGEFVDASESVPASVSSATITESKKAPITVRDFAYPREDERHAGLGPDVPAACDPARLARRLRGVARLSDYASGAGEEDVDDDWGGAFVWGRGRMAFGGGGGSASAAREGGDGGGVGAADFARNFGDAGFDEGEGEGEGYEDEGGEEDELYYAETYADVPPGLYRAQFLFEAIDGAEMDLEEGQLIHVLGSGATATPEGGDGDDEGGGAGAGWAVARERDPPLVLKEAGVLEVNAMVGARTDAGKVWAEMWAQAQANTSPTTTAGTTPTGAAHAPPTERRALVPDSYIVLVRGEGEREADAHARLLRYLDWVERERIRQEEEAAQLAGQEGTGQDSPHSSEEGDYEDAQPGDEGGRLVHT